MNKIIAFWFVFLAMSAPRVIAQVDLSRPSCDVPASETTAAQKVSYLKNAKNTLLIPCVQAAIEGLGSERYVPAIDVLATFLDFRIPSPYRLADGNIIARTPSVFDEYPAARALFRIGAPTTSKMISVIGSEDSSELVCKNAEEVLIATHRNNVAAVISALRSASQAAATGSARSARLGEAARHVAGRCTDESRAACEGALF